MEKGGQLLSYRVLGFPRLLFFSVAFARVYSHVHVDDFNARNKFLTAKLFK